MIYTSYWGNLKNVDQSKVIAVSRYNKFWKGDVESKLFPSVQLLTDYKAGKIDEKIYTYFFKWYLWDNLNVNELKTRCEGKILMCYEKSGFCHRHIISEWFNHFGIMCVELGKGGIAYGER